MKVVHFITRMIIGGAQENTLFTVEDQHCDYGDDVTLLTGLGLGPEGSLIERARSRGLKVEILPELRRDLHPWRDWRSWRSLLNSLRRYRPDVLHTHSSKAGILGRAAASRLDIPVVHTVHGASFHYGQSALAWRVYRAAERWAGPRTDHFISVCDAMTDHYVKAGIAPAERFTTIYSGMEVDPFLSAGASRQAVRQQYGFKDSDVVVGKIARLFPLKGHEFLLQAAPAMVARNPDIRFLLVGDGILQQPFREQIARDGLTEHVRFTGLVPPSEVSRLIGGMDIVVHTSLWEGLARVLPQALISGRPVISYDIDGAREVVIPEQTGILLPPQSVNELTEAVLQLAADSDLRHRFGQTGRERFTDRFRHQTMTRQIREVYQSVLAARQQSRNSPS